MAALKAYRPDIDGMRAIAVASVVAFHFGLFAPGGFVGVDVFFVISGFLIGSLIYQDARAGTFSYLTFYARRARRIVPALLAVLAVTFGAMLVLATPGELREFGANAVAALFSSSNIALWRSIDYFRPDAELNPLLMTWSLGVEEQFYLLAPVFLLLLPRLRVRWRMAVIAGLIVLSLGLAIWGVRHQPEATFFLLPTRAWELAAGVMLGVFDIHRARPGDGEGKAGLALEARALAGLVLILAPVFLYGAATPFPGAAAVPPVLGTVLLLGTGRSAINRRLLSAPPMRFIGLISYSLYLWHWPLISVARLVLVHEPSLALRVGLLAHAVLLAWLSYRFIEQPFRRSRSPSRVVLWRYAGAIGVASVVIGSAFVLRGYPQRWSPGFVAAAREFAHHEDPCLALAGTAAPNVTAGCYPHGAQDRLVAIVGDSHAAALAPGVRTLVARDGQGLAQLTKASCPFLVGVTRKVKRHPDLLRDCAAFDRRAMKMLLGDARIHTVIIAGAWRAGSMRETSYVATDGSEANPDVLFRRGLTAAVATLQAAGKQVIIVQDVPFIGFLPSKQLAACASRARALLNGFAGADRCNFVPGRDVLPDAAAQAILSAVARDTGALLVDPGSALCGEIGCRIAQGGHILYRDEQHLSPAGAALASVAFSGVLAPETAATSNRVTAASPVPAGAH